MKLTFLTIFLAIALYGCFNGQSNTDNFEFAFKTAHPNAQALMKPDFYWSPIEETAPFGSDDGFDAAYGFREWRQSNKKASPVVYLKELIARWQYPFFDYNEMDSTKIEEYIVSKANPDEAYIREQMQLFREALKNSADTAMKNVDDKGLREIIIKSSQDMGGTFLLGQDNAIIGIGFAQFVLEGRVDRDMKALTITAIKRQLLPVLINRYDEGYRQTRKDQLTQMMEVMNKAA